MSFFLNNKSLGRLILLALFLQYISCAGISTDAFLNGDGLGLDRRALQVTNTQPTEGETAVDPSTTIEIFFSKEIDVASLDTTSLTLADLENNFINGTIVYDGQLSKAVFTPETELNGLTEYTFTALAGIQTTDLNQLEDDFTLSFTTRDTTPPEITSVYPTAGDQGVSDKVELHVVFSDDMDPATINATTFTLSQDGDTTAGVVEYDSDTRTATLRPGAELTLKRTYTATVTTGVADTAGNSPETDYSWQFTTGDCPSPDGEPLVTDNQIHAMVRVDCVIYIGGRFENIGTAAPNGIPVGLASAKPVSGYEYQFINEWVLTSAPDGEGGWYIGGHFTEIGGVERNHVARINADGSLHDWNPNAEDNVHKIIVDGDTVYIGGEFTEIGGESRNRLAAFSADGSLLDFDPNIDGYTVYDMVLNAGILYVVGNFDAVGGTTRNNAFAVDTDGNLQSWNPNADGDVLALALSNDIIYLGGKFDNLGGSARGWMGAVHTDGTLYDWSPNVSDGSFIARVRTVAVHDDVVYFGGHFDDVGGNARNNLAGWTAATGQADTGSITTINPNPDDDVRTMLIRGDTLYIGGDFQSVDSTARSNIAALAVPSGTLQTFAPQAAGSVVSTLGFNAEDNHIYIGGLFEMINAQARSKLGAITTDGEILDFNPTVSGGQDVLTMTTDLNTIYFGGDFTTVAGDTRNNIAAVSIDGSLTSFHPITNDRVLDMEIDPDDGGVYIGGEFTCIGATDDCSGTARQYLAKLNTDGSVDTGWSADITSPSSFNVTDDLALWGDNLIVTGNIDTIGGATRNGLAAVARSDGSVHSWNPDIASESLATSSQGLLAGYSTSSLKEGSFFIYSEDLAEQTEVSFTLARSYDQLHAMAFHDGIIYITYHHDDLSTGSSDLYVEGFDLSSSRVFTSSAITSAGGTINEYIFVDQLLFLGGNFDEAEDQAYYNLIVFDADGNVSW